jgi:hypothetical protein
MASVPLAAHHDGVKRVFGHAANLKEEARE